MRHRLSACIAMVVALHAAMLVWASRPADGQAQAQTRPGHSVQVRLRSGGVADTDSHQAAAQSESAVMDSAISPASQAENTEPGPGLATASVQDGDSAIDLAGYVPRRWLTVAPQPTAPVVLPFPATFNDAARYTVVLNLYIEADGRVGRIEFEGVPLPEVLERAARVTFENAHFTPGQVKGRIVKSLIRVEVDFDNLGQG